MRHLILVGLLAATAAPLVAQVASAPVAAPQPMAHRMTMGMAKTMTRAEVQAQVQTQFARRDANRDGFLTTDELAMRKGMDEGRMEMRRGMANRADGGAMRDPAAAFDRVDTNRDGAISRDEFAQGRQVRIDKRVVLNGQPGVAGAMPMEHGRNGGMRHGGGGGMMGAAMLKMADTNRDGKVSLAEATSRALQHFDMMDANRDGRLTPEERQAGRAHMKQMRVAG